MALANSSAPLGGELSVLDSLMPPPEEAWAAVLARDARFDGHFVYAVSSTGVFCRPVCPSRRPRREHVSFFASAAAAAAAGYRPCRRCRPGTPGSAPAVASVERARAYLDAHLEDNVSLERLARVAHLSPFHLQRTFKRLLGLSPREYVQRQRAERLKQGLRAGETVSRAAFDAGYGSTSRLYEQAPEQLGMTPATYRRGGEGVRIRFSTTATQFGRLLVAYTDRGLCAVALGSETAALERELRDEYPRAELVHADEAASHWVAGVVELLEGGGDHLELPLDLEATAFQWRVWRALQRIPAGSTRTYGQIAAELGMPHGARAVGRACASNRVAVVIPCHRVVREDGQLGGYRWGVERKQRLLDREQGAPGTTDE